MPSIFTLRSSTLRSGADLRADILAPAQSPATITVTPVALGVSAAISLALSPATITVTPVVQGVTPGGVSLAQSPSTVTVTGIAPDITPGSASPALTPATITVTPLGLGLTVGPGVATDTAGGGGKWDVTRASRDAWRKQTERESMLARDDEELLVVI